MPLLCETMVLGVTGSVAAADSPVLVRRLRGEVARHVHVVLSRAAKKLVMPRALELNSGHAVLSDAWDESAGMRVSD